MNKLDESGRIVYRILGAIGIPLGLFIAWQIYLAPSGKNLILINASSLMFHGKVDSVYYDKTNHNAKVLILSDGSKYDFFAGYSEADLGDSLSKEKGSLIVKVFKKNGQGINLDYKKLVKTLNLN